MLWISGFCRQAKSRKDALRLTRDGVGWVDHLGSSGTDLLDDGLQVWEVRAAKHNLIASGLEQRLNLGANNRKDIRVI